MRSKGVHELHLMAASLAYEQVLFDLRELWLSQQAHRILLRSFRCRSGGTRGRPVRRLGGGYIGVFGT